MPERKDGSRSPALPGRPTEAVLKWLLEPSQPSVRYSTLTDLLGRSSSDPEAVSARGRIAHDGWVPELLDRQNPDGTWGPGERLYVPKYRSTNWILLVLADLGATRDDPRVARACELWLDRFAKPDGGFNGDGASTGHLCLTGNTARALVRFGYADDRRVRAAFDWLVAHQAKLGGWSCFGSGRNLDSWEGLAAFAAFPRARWTPEMERAVARGAEFFLSRELHRQGPRYPPWYRLHYPVHYYYDVLVGLDVLTELGYGGDPRLGAALGVVNDLRRRDGRWNLGPAHPDVEGPVATWFEKHPKQRPVPLLLETVGEPSKMVTLRALRVLDRVERARRTGTQPPGGA